MENKKALIFALRISTIIIGVALFKQFDFQNLKFEKPALGMVYFVTFVFCCMFRLKMPKTNEQNL